MSSMMRLDIKEKTKILKDLKHRKIQHFNKEIQKLFTIIEEHHFLDAYKEELEALKKGFIEKLNTITMNDLDYERHDYIANQAESEYIQKLFDLKSRILSKKEKYLAIIANYEIKDTTKYIEDFIQDEKKEFELMLDMLKRIDEEEHSRIMALDNALELKLKEAKVTYLKLLNTRLIKEDLQSMIDTLGPDEQEQVAELLQQRYIDKKTFQTFMHTHYMNQQSEEFKRIQESFESLGYTFEEDIKDNTLQYISTNDHEYKIAIRVVDGKVSLAFTRLVPKGTTLSEYEKAKDIEKANQWCSDFDKVKAVMQANGLAVDEEMRVEPTTVENIRYEEVDELIDVKGTEKPIEAGKVLE
jgi:hypothetical protein